MDTTTLKVRVSTAGGQPVPGATVRAALNQTGVSSADGYVDRSPVEGTANDDGVAELALWPSAEGESGAEYRVTARGADGRRLLDESVTVPASSAPVWLHDIVMVPPPTPKPYDEAAIEAIQQNRIKAQDARAGSESARDTAVSARGETVTASTNAQQAESGAEAAQVAAGQYRNQAKTFKAQAQQSASESATNRQESAASSSSASDSATEASSTLADIVDIYGSATALQQARDDAVQAAQQTSDDSSAASADASAAHGSAVGAESSATSARDHQSRTRTLLLSTQEASAKANAALTGSRDNRDAADRAAEKSQVHSAESITTATWVDVYSRRALDRSADLIAQASSTLSDITQAEQSATGATDKALGLYGDAKALSDAVDAARQHKEAAGVSESNAQASSGSAQTFAGQASSSAGAADVSANESASQATTASNASDSAGADRQATAILRAKAQAHADAVQARLGDAEQIRDSVSADARQVSDDVKVTYANRLIANATLSTSLIVRRS